MGKKKSKPTQVVVMSSKRRLTRRKAVGLMLVLLLLTVAAGIAVAMVLTSDKGNGDAEDNTPKTTAQAIEATDKLRYSNNYEGAVSQASQAYEDSDSDDDKYVLAQQTAAIYESNKDYDNAIEWYLKADELKPNQRGPLGGLGRCYEAKGDKQKAIGYYKKVVALKDVTGEGVQNDQAYYQYLIDRLSEKQ
jgi:tetratricopeptide (TPR) repeat protein